MAEKLLIVMMNTDPSNPEEITLPIQQAMVAAAMDYSVEMIFSGRAGELVQRSVAQEKILQDDPAKTVYDLLREAHEKGVVIKACHSALSLWGKDFIDEIDEVVGDTYLISEAMDADTVTFTY